MEVFSQLYDPFLSGLDPWSPPSESSSSSNSDGGMSGRRMDISNEQVMLASCNPKKRAGRKKFRETRHPVYRGVRLRKSGKWVCEVREPNKKTRIWLGTFPTADMAARAHDVAAIALRGKSACLNFADSSWRLPVPASGEAKDIQKAAAQAAEAFRPMRSDDEVLEEVVTEECEERMVALPESVFFIDEEAVFGMPELLANMAEGLLIPPPYYPGDGYYGNDVEFDADMSLWSY